MWSNVISIDKGIEEHFLELQNEIDGVKEVSSAVEESKNRRFLYMAGLCEYSDIIIDKIDNIVADFILTRYKLKYYLKNIKFNKLDFAIVTLLYTLIYLDYELEKTYIKKVFQDVASYDIDGIFNFRLKNLRTTWTEIAEMCNHLFDVGTDEQDIYNVISYIAESKSKVPKELIVNNSAPLNIENEEGKTLKIRKLFNVDAYDIIGTVIENSATKLTLKCDISNDAIKALKHIVRVNY